MNHREFDLICMGRAAVDLYADQIGADLENVTTFSKYLGGCPANVAVGTSRLGLQTAMLTRVGHEAMGRFVKGTLKDEGVDVSMVLEDPDRLTGLVLLGVNPPDNFPLIFYRENCADTAIEEDDFSVESFERARALLVTGTHFSTEELFKTSCKAVELAKSVDTKIILDIDFRPVLWGLTGHGDGESRYVEANIVTERLKTIFDKCDLIVGTDEELKIASGLREVDGAIEYLKEQSSGLIVRKKGQEGCEVHASYSPEAILGEGFQVPVFNVLGAGDAFLSGFLRGWLAGQPLSTCCTWGNACGALVVSRHGCSAAIPFWLELQEFLASRGRINLSDLERRHAALGRLPKDVEDLCVMAFDHRSFFAKYRVPSGKVSSFKALLYLALLQVDSQNLPVKLGTVLDVNYSSSFLNEIDTKSLWCASCIEEPDTYPLEFSQNKEAAMLLRNRPKQHVVKVLVKHPLGISNEDFDRQVQKLQNLQQACTDWEQELLVELIPQPSTPECLKTIPQLIEDYYEEGIFPTWWKLPPIQDEQTWERVRFVIAQNDQNCRGVLILGHNENLEQLSTTLQKLSSRDFIKGFVVGRSIWGEAAEKWFKDEMSDEEVIETVASRYTFLINAWRQKPANVGSDDSSNE